MKKPFLLEKNPSCLACRMEWKLGHTAVSCGHTGQSWAALLLGVRRMEPASGLITGGNGFFSVTISENLDFIKNWKAALAHFAELKALTVFGDWI